jgi:hypothetical protein
MTVSTYFRVAGTSDVPASHFVQKECIHCKNDVFFLMTQDQYERWQIKGQFIQNVFPHIDTDVREWMVSGTHPECWEELFGNDLD